MPRSATMDSPSPESVLPAMSYTHAEVKPLATKRPTEAQVRARAHQIWLARDGAAGNPTLDWLQAEMELEAELRTGRLTPGREAPVVEVSGTAGGSAASMVEARPEQKARLAREDAPRARSRAA